MEKNPINKFIELINNAIAEGKFVKLTLSKATKPELAKNIYCKPVELKKGKAISCIYRYETKDITKNFLIGNELTEQLNVWLGNEYKIATLITETEEIQLVFNKKNEAQINTKKLKTERTAMQQSHNSEKNYLIPENAKFLQLLGVSSKDGKLLKDHHDKYRQINKYAEIMKSLIDKSSL